MPMNMHERPASEETGREDAAMRAMVARIMREIEAEMAKGESDDGHLH